MKMKVEIFGLCEGSLTKVREDLKNIENIEKIEHFKEGDRVLIEANACLSGLLQAIRIAASNKDFINTDEAIDTILSFKPQEKLQRETIVGFLDTIYNTEWEDILEILGAIKLMRERLQEGDYGEIVWGIVNTFRQKFYNEIPF